MKKTVAAFAILTAAFSAIAADSPTADAVKDKLAKALDVPRENIRPSAVAGFYECSTIMTLGTSAADGKYLLQGDLINIETGEQITENHRRADRLVALKALDKDNTIEFAPKAPFTTKYTVTVFTDMDCHYCQLLHSQVADYNAAGIALRYAFFPRTGPNTELLEKGRSGVVL